ncbi:uncharacterized protein LOC117643424 isoform X2 [Thrips palmi]|uniref:Uncharacterized protein LOC117643424 isoform X2 n=1 Tax=Thrips palmi TaxID=161013 RepID=A0A6P8YVN8_THRPL|nr:uncharacterized protein LOC117643424 isoform X2 [Thrips palmi]
MQITTGGRRACVSELGYRGKRVLYKAMFSTPQSQSPELRQLQHSTMKISLLFVAIAVVALAQMGCAAPQPKPFNFGKLVSKVGNVMSDKGNCLVKKGVPKSLLKKAIGCSPSAFIGVGTYAACAGIASIPDARNAVSCFTG